MVAILCWCKSYLQSRGKSRGSTWNLLILFKDFIMAYFFSIKVKMFSTLGPYIFPASYLQLVNWICGGRDRGEGGMGVDPFQSCFKALSLILLLSFYLLRSSVPSPFMPAPTFPDFPVD